jgi:serine/threonine protein kinase
MAHLDRAGPSGPRGAAIRSPRAEVVDISNVRTRTFSPLRRLGDYELLRKIGSGGMAEVWMGRRAAMAGASKAVAIKLLAREVLDDPTYRTMFLEEARLSMLLTNSNVVQVFDVGEINGECFMVMEWVDGLNLSELTQKLGREGERLSAVVAAHVIGEVLRALAYAHGLHHDGAQATIVHRDVSPHNVLVSISGEVKLADFGVARLAREETSGLHVKGKLRYMAPEQLRGRSRDPTVDLYAVGAVFHEMLEGQRFRSTRDEGDLYALVLSGEYPPLTASVPPELDHLRSRLLDPDPKRRIQTADEALELLAMWPGYRNSSVELGKLIRRWVGVGAPRSGIVSSESLLGGGGQAVPGPRAASGPSAASSGPSAVSVAATTPANPTNPPAGDSEAATAVEASRPELPARDTNPPQADRGVTLTRTASVGLDEPETLPTSIIAAEPGPRSSAPGPRSSAPSMLIVVALTLAISFGVFGLGFPLGWWGGAGGSTVAAVPETSTTEPTEPTEPAEPIEAPKPAGTTGPIEATTRPAATASGTSTTGDSQDAIETPSPPPDLPIVKEVVDKKVEKVRPATVEFNIGTFPFVYVLVDGKQLTLEPRGTMKLKPGSHSVKFRVDDADPWKTAKTKIEVESGKSYKVKMQQPSDLTIEKL